MEEVREERGRCGTHRAFSGRRGTLTHGVSAAWKGSQRRRGPDAGKRALIRKTCSSN